ncbi:MAG: adenine deaminase [Gaiellales bacterium]|nr:adenine deaminase [Gaiellales bacterium]
MKPGAERCVAGTIVDPVTGEVYAGAITVSGGRIARIERNDAVPGPGPRRFILPGLVDAHVHVESSMLTPSQFARMAVRHGTVATVSDPHEIANALGLPGVEYMIRNGAAAPFTFAFGAPSCVPATPFETAGAELGPGEVDALLARPDIRYLSEMMNFPGVLAGDAGVMAKLASARRYGKPVDGHAPGLRGDDLQRYIDAGISTDHESLDYEEAREKIERGMKVLIREGSAAREFDLLAGLIDEFPERCMLCSDDLHPTDLVRGHINSLLRRGVAAGLGLTNLLRCATVNPVRHYGLEVGLLQLGDPADMVVVADLEDFDAVETYVRGELVAVDGAALWQAEPGEEPNMFAAAPVREESFAVGARPGKINVMEALDGQLVTPRLQLTPTISADLAVADPSRDLLKIAVVNRYRPAPPAVGFIRNFGLATGAMASSVAHDSHNIVAVGASDEALALAINRVRENQGGLAVATPEGVYELPLPVAGLMSTQDGWEVAEAYDAVERAAKDLGSTLTSPFMTLSFMSLLVIPSLKMSDEGLFDGDSFSPVDLFVR